MARVPEVQSDRFNVGLSTPRVPSGAFVTTDDGKARVDLAQQLAGIAAAVRQHQIKTEVESAYTEMLKATANLETEIINSVPAEQALDVYQEQFRSITDGFIDNATNDESRFQIEQIRDRLMAREAASVGAKATKLMIERQLIAYGERLDLMEAKYATAATPQDAQNALLEIFDTLNTMGDQNLLADEEVQKAMRTRAESAMANRVLRLVSEGQVANASAFLQSVKDSLPPEKVIELQGKIETAHNKIKAQIRADADLEVLRLDEQIDTRPFEVDADVIPQMVTDGKLTRSEGLSLLRRLRANRESAADDAVMDASILRWLAGEPTLPPDWSDPDTKKAADRVVLGHIIPGIAKSLEIEPGDVLLMRNPDATAELANVVARLGFVPQRVGGAVRGFLRAGDVDQAANAAEFIARVEEFNPMALQGVTSADDERFATMATGLIRSGMNPARAIERARTSVFEIDPGVSEIRAKRFKDNSEKWIESVVSSFDDTFFGSPTVPDEVLAAASLVLEAEYLATGDEDTAKARTQRILSRQYARSSVGGPDRVTAYPAEVWYGMPNKSKAENAAWINEQLLSEFRAALPTATIIGPDGHLITDPLPENVRLISNSTHTIRTGQRGRPEYIIGYEITDIKEVEAGQIETTFTGPVPGTGTEAKRVPGASTGIIVPVFDRTGRPLTFVPDYASSEQAKRDAAAVQQRIDKANAEIRARYEASIRAAEAREKFLERFGPESDVDILSGRLFRDDFLGEVGRRSDILSGRLFKGPRVGGNNAD